MIKFILVFLILFMNWPMVALAQIAVVPLGDDLFPIAIGQNCPPSNPVTVEDVICKPIIFNKGWDTNVPNLPKIDPTVNIVFQGISNGAVTYNGPEIRHWGLQTYFPVNLNIYAKAVLLVDKGDTVEGGVFEWSLNNQGSVHLINIVRTDFPNVAWLANWTDPTPGDTVWYFIMSDDERFASHPFSFIWPSGLH